MPHQNLEHRKLKQRNGRASNTIPRKLYIINTRQHNPNNEQYIFQKMSTGFNSLIDGSQIQVLGASTLYSKEWNGPRNIGKRG